MRTKMETKNYAATTEPTKEGETGGGKKRILEGQANRQNRHVTPRGN